MPLKKSLAEFPMKIGKWEGKQSRFDETIYKLLGVDESLLADYYDSKGQNVQLYIGYYKSQRQGDIIHSPRNCMPGAGWNITETSKIVLDLKNPSKPPIHILQLVLQNGAYRQIAFYWYHARGRIVTSEYLQKFYLFWDSITKHRTDESFVRLITPITNSNQDQAIQLLKQFTEEIFPIIEDHISSS